jgi:predicted membrane channel-forming protein YqfA (hemolysin III family)
MRELAVRHRAAILLSMLAASIAALWVMGPTAQPLAYHGFSDTRSWLGIPNFGDVMSNLPYAAAGGFGLWLTLGPRGRDIFTHPAHRRPYVVFFLGVVLTGMGSAYYHLAPDNARLVWDRLPIAIIVMALSAAFIADRIHERAGNGWALAALVGAGIASVLRWHWSELAGQGDLRFYLLVQTFPMAALPAICILYRRARYTSGRHLAWLMAWYVLGRAFEVLDSEIFRLLGGAVGGHALKQLAALGSVMAIIRMLLASRESR